LTQVTIFQTIRLQSTEHRQRFVMNWRILPFRFKFFLGGHVIQITTNDTYTGFTFGEMSETGDLKLCPLATKNRLHTTHRL